MFQNSSKPRSAPTIGGLEWLKGLDVKEVYYATPEGQSLDLPFDPVWLTFVEKIYQLAMCPKEWMSQFLQFVFHYWYPGPLHQQFLIFEYSKPTQT